VRPHLILPLSSPSSLSHNGSDDSTNLWSYLATFIVPGELFPTRYRSTAHGISAASGKVGAIIAQVVFYKFSVDTAQPNDVSTLRNIGSV
jgi:hypothetical protein